MPPDTIACPPWCGWHEDGDEGNWTHARMLVDEPLHGLRVQLSYGGVFEGGPGEHFTLLEILSPHGHMCMPATAELLRTFAAVAEAADLV